MKLIRALGLVSALAGPATASGQDRDSLTAAGVGVYRPAPAASDTVEAPPPAAPVAADTSETPDTADPADTVAGYAPGDTSLTARMDVRRGGGLSRSEFPDLRRAAELAGHHAIFIELADRTELGDQLTGSRFLTVLAPTDSAFGLLSAGDLKRLREDAAFREAWLGTVVLDGSLGSRDLLGRKEGRSLGGQAISVSRERDGWIHAGPARIVHPDLIARNGTLHGVDRVILPDTTSASP